MHFFFPFKKSASLHFMDDIISINAEGQYRDKFNFDQNHPDIVVLNSIYGPGLPYSGEPQKAMGSSCWPESVPKCNGDGPGLVATLLLALALGI